MDVRKLKGIAPATARQVRNNGILIAEFGVKRLLMKAKQANSAAACSGDFTPEGDCVRDLHMNEGPTKGFIHQAGNDSNDRNDIWQDGALIGWASWRNNGAASASESTMAFPQQCWLMGRDRRSFIRTINSSCKRALQVLCKLSTPMRVVLVGIAFLAVCFVVNLVYQILHKPTEVFALIPGESNKAPIETWRQYAPLFREYSTTSISPELLAALAQVESAGNPIARTYWRWSLTSDPFAVYQPASSAVGMYQMTDAALAEVQGYCILHHTVVESGCSATAFHSRVVPRHATEFTAVFLDRKVAAILGHRRKSTLSRQQREELAAIIHLCGTGPATAFARRGFRLMPGERCGDHDVAAYLAQINAMKRQFLSLAVGG